MKIHELITIPFLMKHNCLDGKRHYGKISWNIDKKEVVTVDIFAHVGAVIGEISFNFAGNSLGMRGGWADCKNLLFRPMTQFGRDTRWFFICDECEKTVQTLHLKERQFRCADCCGIDLPFMGKPLYL